MTARVEWGLAWLAGFVEVLEFFETRVKMLQSESYEGDWN